MCVHICAYVSVCGVCARTGVCLQCAYFRNKREGRAIKRAGKEEDKVRGRQKDRRMKENERPARPTMLLPAPPVNAPEWGTSAPLSIRGNKLKGHPPDDGGDGLKPADRVPTMACTPHWVPPPPTTGEQAGDSSAIRRTQRAAVHPR